MIPLRIRMWHKLFCGLGFHEWRDSAVIMKHGFRAGDRCIRCRVWSNDSTPIQTETEENEKYYN